MTSHNLQLPILVFLPADNPKRCERRRVIRVAFTGRDERFSALPTIHFVLTRCGLGQASLFTLVTWASLENEDFSHH
jgi:hypothetical protein